MSNASASTAPVGNTSEPSGISESSGLLEPSATSPASSSTPLATVDCPQKHAQTVSFMFSRIAGSYDVLNHILSGGMDFYWRWRFVRYAKLFSTNRFLDLATGTFDVSLSLAKRFPKATIYSMDYCEAMIRKGLPKVAKKQQIIPAVADARHIPLPDASIDTVTISFGIRNVQPRHQAFAEMYRVLAPNGRLCILEFGGGDTPIWQGIYNFYLHKLLPFVGKIVSGDGAAYAYLATTIKSFPNAEELAEELRTAGFGNVTYTSLTSGIVRIHVAEKTAPEAR